MNRSEGFFHRVAEHISHGMEREEKMGKSEEKWAEGMDFIPHLEDTVSPKIVRNRDDFTTAQLHDLELGHHHTMMKEDLRDGWENFSQYVDTRVHHTQKHDERAPKLIEKRSTTQTVKIEPGRQKVIEIWENSMDGAEAEWKRAVREAERITENQRPIIAEKRIIVEKKRDEPSLKEKISDKLEAAKDKAVEKKNELKEDFREKKEELRERERLREFERREQDRQRERERENERLAREKKAPVATVPAREIREREVVKPAYRKSFEEVKDKLPEDDEAQHVAIRGAMLTPRELAGTTTVQRVEKFHVDGRNQVVVDRVTDKSRTTVVPEERGWFSSLFGWWQTPEKKEVKTEIKTERK